VGHARAFICRAALVNTTVDRLEIHCDAENRRSAAVATRLGFQLTRTILEDVVTARGDRRNTLVWTMYRGGARYVDRAVTDAGGLALSIAGSGTSALTRRRYSA
jgi:RimJ/RimL family protein N-acetyltransferase